jgi:hypothetical protein
MNVRPDGDNAFVAEQEGDVLGSLSVESAGEVVLRLREPREAVALALLRAAAATAHPEAADERLPSFGSVHLQTDDQGAVVQLVARMVPRVFHSQATVVSAPRNGWVSVYDEVADRNPNQLKRLGRELSNASGLVVFTIGVEEGKAVHFIAFERGRILDEYFSVPGYRGPIAPGDAVALRANPTVVARLTGANPARLRAVARTAESPDELPPPDEHILELSEVLGIAGAEHGFETARELPEAMLVEHR